MLLRHGTDYEAIMARTSKACGLAVRSSDWAARWYRSAALVGHTLTDQFWMEFGFRPGNFGEPQSLALPIGTDPTTGKPVEKLINTWPRPDIAGAWVPKGYPFRIPASVDGYYTAVSPGSDHQGEVHRAGVGVWSLWGGIGPQSPTSELVNRHVAELANHWNLRPANVSSDQFAWSAGFTPDGARGNATNVSPAMPPWCGAIGPDEVQYAIDNNTTLDRAFTMGVDRRCSMNGPLAPLSIRDCEDPRIGVDFGCSAPPALHLETKAPYYTVANEVPDGMRLAVQKTADQIDGHLKAKGFVIGSPGWKAGFLLLQNLTYSEEGHGAVQAQTGGSAIIPLNTAPLAVNGRGDKTVPSWSRFGFTAQTDLLGGFIESVDDIVCCGIPTSVDAHGQEWRRDVLAASTGF